VRILVVNAGSSNLKLRVLDNGDRVVGSADLTTPGERIDEAALARAVSGFEGVEAVGHRIVHGGRTFSSSVFVDDRVVEQLHALSHLAPLHQPRSLAALECVDRILSGVPSVACFDTAFHASLPEAAATYAIPSEWRSRHGIRRFGFHGLSHAYAARRACELLRRSPAETRLVTCHLGAGASLAAVSDGRSMDTTMGFTPLEGLVMATRSGSVDPGLVLWLQEHASITASEVADGLERRSGLYGLAGTPDMREVLRRAADGDGDASLALDVYTHRLRTGIAAMAAAMGGLDVLVFTGGVGENAPAVRERAARGLGFLGVELDRARNDAAGGDVEIGSPRATARTLVVRAREDLEIAREVRRLFQRPAG
jgi:acetate kinase